MSSYNASISNSTNETVISDIQSDISTSKAQNTSEWRQQIKKNLLERVTPELINEIKSKADSNRRAIKSLKKVSKIERVNYLSSVSNERTLKSYSAQDRQIPSIAIEERNKASTMNSIRQQAFQTVFKKSVALEEENDEEDEEEEMLLNSIERDLEVNNTTEDIASAHTASANDVESLLSQLKTEPTEENELIAKFSLYENFLETVTVARTTTIDFWNNSKDQFTPDIALITQRDIDKLDHHDNLGIHDYETRFWFVYYMTKKANQNSKFITEVLSRIKSKLSLLSQELGECPFCLDQMVPESVYTINCGHRTCSFCWDNWTAIKRNQAFCPLCKYNEFVHEIVSND